MSKLPDKVINLSGTLTLCEYTDHKNGAFGFWLYDQTRGMNLSMRAKTSTEAFVEAITYYQERLQKVERDYKSLSEKVYSFVGQFVGDIDD